MTSKVPSEQALGRDPPVDHLTRKLICIARHLGRTASAKIYHPWLNPPLSMFTQAPSNRCDAAQSAKRRPPLHRASRLPSLPPKASDSRETPRRPVLLHLPRLYPGHPVPPCVSISGCSSIDVGPPSEKALGVVSNISPFTSRYILLVLGMLAARLWHCYHQHHLNG